MVKQFSAVLIAAIILSGQRAEAQQRVKPTPEQKKAAYDSLRKMTPEQRKAKFKAEHKRKPAALPNAQSPQPEIEKKK